MEFIEKNEIIFNTKVYQKAAINESIDCKAIINEASEIMKKYELMLSLFLEHSDVGRINSKAHKEYVKVCEETFEIIDTALYYGRLTDGLFDISIAPVMKKWKINSLTPQIPSDEELNYLLSLVDYRNIELNYKEKSVRFKKAGMKIDLGGIAKGYIADKIIEFYKQKGIKSAIINLGGNIKVLGNKDDVLWNIGIMVPEKHSREIACAVNIKSEMSVVTSGSYERAFKCGNKIYHHIIDPKTGYPCESDLKSITIISRSSFECDGFSTPLFMMGSVKAAEFMKKYNIEGLMITKKDEIIIKKNLINDFKLCKAYKVMCF